MFGQMNRQWTKKTQELKTIKTNHLEFFLNLLLFNIHKLDVQIHYISNKINIFLLLSKVPFIQRKFDETGSTLHETVNKLWIDRRYGFGIMISSAALAFLLFLFLFSAYLLVNGISSGAANVNWRIPFFTSVVLSFCICYYCVFKGEKYLRYFKQFDNWSKREEWKYGLMSAFFLISVVSLLYFSHRYW